MPENGKTFTIKMWRPTKKETDNLWKLYHAAVRLQDRWHSNTVPVIAEELSATDLTRHEKMFLLRAWQMLVDDHARLDRFLGAFDTYLLNFQDPDAEHVAYKPELRQLLEKAISLMWCWRLMARRWTVLSRWKMVGQVLAKRY
ncbi:TPA: hypothetical protein ACQ8UR_003896 [Escherichia coli]